MELEEALKYINTTPLERLRDLEFMEKKFLPTLGINDQGVRQHPEDIREHVGGLKSWQSPIQFAPYLIHISKLNLASYLEIGVHKLGTFIITVEYLRRFNPSLVGYGIDLTDYEHNTDYLENEYVKVDYVSSNDEIFLNWLSEGWDLVMIDGDHSIGQVRIDYNNCRQHAKYLAFHDINSVCRHSWKEISKNHKDKVEFKELYIKKLKWFGIGLIKL